MSIATLVPPNQINALKAARQTFWRIRKNQHENAGFVHGYGYEPERAFADSAGDSSGGRELFNTKFIELCRS